MRRFPAVSVASVVVLLALLLVALAGCGKGGGGGNSGQTATVTMDANTFVHNNATYTLKAGQALNFVDPSSSGGIHILCFGRNGQCDKSQTTGPKELQGDGFQIDAGQSKSVTFSTPGTYPIACSIHPVMQITVVVQ